MRRGLWILMAAVVVSAFALGAGVAPRLESASAIKPVDRMTPDQRAAIENLKSFSVGFQAVAELVTPAVVTISSEKTVQPADAPSPFGNDPFFRRFFGNPHGGQSQPYTQRGLGSGVIVDPDGVILTNNHVVRGADELTVILHDGTRLEAEVVGADARTDVAVLRVDARELPAMVFGDSEDVRIGQWVMAIGSPFSENLQHSVTAGIVSAVGRSGMNLNEYEYFIQTDAAINPGNSGGALVNLDGELVGINSAIASRNGGSNGIGFAIPSNMAMEVMDDLLTDGKVTRGWLGVSIQDVNQDLAEAMGLPGASGVLVNSVVPGSPAEDAGMRQGDVIVRIDGDPMPDSARLRLQVARANPGETVAVEVIRDGEARTLRVNLGEFPEHPQTLAGRVDRSFREELGITLQPMTPELTRQFELDAATEGLVVTAVAPGSPAGETGLQPGDVVLKVNRRPVTTLAGYETVLEAAAPEAPVLLLVDRAGSTFFVAIRPE